MTSNKVAGVKSRLIKKVKQNYSVPTWVIVKTKRKVRSHSKKRSWRRGRLKVA